MYCNVTWWHWKGAWSHSTTVTLLLENLYIHAHYNKVYWSLFLVCVCVCVCSLSVEDSVGVEERSALIPSLFPFFPPTLYFSTANERGQSSPRLLFGVCVSLPP